MTDETFKKLVAMRERRESLRETAYRDSQGFLTIGYGHCIDKHKDHAKYANATLTEREAASLLLDDLSETVVACSSAISWFNYAPEIVQAVIASMAFNMGIAGVLGFRNTLNALRNGDMKSAAKGIYASKMARQTDEEGELMYMLLAGEFME